MTAPLVYALPGNEAFTRSLLEATGWEAGQLETRNFPDGESYVRLGTEPAGRSVVFVCTLHLPDEKFLKLTFSARAARDQGAARVGLIAPYLSYLRQDKVFNPGEALTSVHFARLVSSNFDWLVTIDPHLHRYKTLDEIYSIPAKAGHATRDLATWIAANVKNPVLIGPDIESEQWVAETAGFIGAPFEVLRKVRTGDRQVEISLPDLRNHNSRTPVLLDDIASSGQTLVEASRKIVSAGFGKPVCVVVHGLFASAPSSELLEASAVLVSTNTIVSAATAIDVAGVTAELAMSFV